MNNLWNIEWNEDWSGELKKLWTEAKILKTQWENAEYHYLEAEGEFWEKYKNEKTEILEEMQAVVRAVVAGKEKK